MNLILTKMMRVDPQDRQDIRFLLAQLQTNLSGLLPALDTAAIPTIPEIETAFQVNRIWLLEEVDG